MSREKADYFDGIADKWDGFEDLQVLARKLAEGLEQLEVGVEETVLDVGCGTGNLTKALLERLGPKGRVIAVDISPRMIEVAKGKIRDNRVTWHIANAQRLPMSPASCHRVLCYSVWPHFGDGAATAAELARVLRHQGQLHVWHLLGRSRVNEIHASAGPAVQKDILASAEELSFTLMRLGFQVTKTVDTDTNYLVSATKMAE